MKSDIQKRSLIKKLWVLSVGLLLAGTCLTGCNPLKYLVENYYRHYEQEDADQIEEKGTEMMQAWLEENMPDAEMTECSVRIENITYSAHVYLTDYVTGRICVSEEEKIFAMDTATGEVYFECSPFVKEQLNELAADYFYETMGIAPEGSDSFFECYVLAPFRDEGREVHAYQFNYGFDFGLPAGVEDLEAFVREPASRPLLYVRANITLPEETDLFAYDFAAFETLSEKCGMFLGSVSVENGTQDLQRSTRNWITKVWCSEYGRWIERDGFWLSGQVKVRREERHDLTNEMTRFDWQFDPERDLVFEETATGYEYYLPNEDCEDEVFHIYAHKDAKILEYNFIDYFYSDVAGFVAGEYDTDEQDGTETVWCQQKNGLYVLSSKSQNNPVSFSHAGRLERIRQDR